MNSRLNDKQAFVMVNLLFASVSLLSNLPLKGFLVEASGVQPCGTVATWRGAHTAPSQRRGRAPTVCVQKPILLNVANVVSKQERSEMENTWKKKKNHKKQKSNLMGASQ